MSIAIGAVVGIIAAAILDHFTEWAKGFWELILGPSTFVTYFLGSYGESTRKDIRDWFDFEFLPTHLKTVVFFGAFFGGTGGLLIDLIRSLM